MAVEIRELVIKAVIDDNALTEGGDTSDKQAMIAACVEEVVKIMERKKQR